MKKLILPFLLFLLMCISADGQSTVKLLLPNNCEESITVIEEQKSDIGCKLEIYPNPNRGKFLLSITALNSIDKGDITVSNSVGKVIYKETVYCKAMQLKKTIDLVDVNPGTYILNFINNNEKFISKFIIE